MEYQINSNQIQIILPITTPTGKVRVKRPVDGHSGNTVASRTVPFEQGDYLEWQISYDNESQNAPSVVPNVVLKKPQGIRYGCELVRLLVEARNLGFLTDERFNELNNLVQVPFQSGIEEREQILRVAATSADIFATKFGFKRYYLNVPNYWKSSEYYSVEVRIAAKQRAVGNQAMIFVNIPLLKCESQNGSPLIGRCANRKERVIYTIGKHNVDLVYDTIVAFAFASISHLNDLRMIFKALTR